MRLLNVETFKFQSFRENNRPKYVILSHRWVEDQEVTLEDVQNERNTDFSGYKKILRFADYVKQYIPEIEWIWVDICCIDKKNAVELSKSLNLMFGWYRDAELCIAYMADVDEAGDKARFEQSEWFLRGWTLQELLAPRTVVFVTTAWSVIGHKGPSSRSSTEYCVGPGLEADIARITGIKEHVVHDYSAFTELASEIKMGWMERRTTTEAEDRWYALFGILGVTPGANYGEGCDGAKQRLLRAINRKDSVNQKLHTTVEQAAQFRDIVAWLDPPDPWTNHNSARELREPDSGYWLLRSDAYQNWKTASNHLLWTYGKAGCGKTVLSSTAIEDVKRYCNDRPNSGYAIFYFTFSDNRKQRLVNLLKSLVAQLGWKAPALHLLQLAYSKPNRSLLGLHDLREVVVACLKAYDEVFLLLDALDEASEDDDNRHVVLEWLGHVLDEAAHVKILATSRELPDIRDRMIELDARRMPIPSSSVNEDIRRYTVAQLAANRRLSGLNQATQQLIEDTITAKADGMFRWAFCQLQELKRLKSTKPSNVEKALKDLPKTLDETYERMLTMIPDESRSDAVAMLRLLAFSRKPPSLNELAEITIIDWEEDGHVNTEDRAGFADALEILSGLIIVIGTGGDHDDPSEMHDADRQEDTSPHIDGETRIRLAHFSVQEYLESERIKQSNAHAFQFEKGREHKILTHSCLAYLTYYSGCDERLSQRRDLKTFPLLGYTANSWYYHSPLQQPSDVSRELRFLSDQRIVEHWLMGEYVECGTGNFTPLIHSIGSGLYYASLLGLEVIFDEFLKCKANPNVQGGFYGSTLQAACYGGNERVVQILLDSGADVNAQGGYDNNALQAACYRGNERVVQILLDAGADVNAQGGYFGYALNTACNGGNGRLVQILLDAEADVNAAAETLGQRSNALDEATKEHQKCQATLVEAQGGDCRVHKYRDDMISNEEMVARKKKWRNIVQMLEEAGAVLPDRNESESEDWISSDGTVPTEEVEDS
ncbi:hypothetical protein CBER1_02774 [Cercospora berteroae]|uniref:Uncharacterized protein n=1 Tax=Cercospora berteroae TaxID=357750 RepID=A0A2S6C6P4_9PEZI|nr:hypothetical protein CBER1_02774 [Cercospora berteroae]